MNDKEAQKILLQLKTLKMENEKLKEENAYLKFRLDELQAKQRCLARLFRDLEKVIEYWRDDREVLRYCRRLGKLLADAMALYKEYKNKEWDERYYTKRARINDTLRDFSFPNPNKRILKRFANRLAGHNGEMLTFLYIKDIDPHNNHAEQQIRPDVIFRKITFGNRSVSGAKNHSIIMTILQTAKLNNMDPIKTLEDILLSRKNKNPFAKILSPPEKNHSAHNKNSPRLRVIGALGTVPIFYLVASLNTCLLHLTYEKIVSDYKSAMIDI